LAKLDSHSNNNEHHNNSVWNLADGIPLGETAI
jgi:hypothetical protein